MAKPLHSSRPGGAGRETALPPLAEGNVALLKAAMDPTPPLSAHTLFAPWPETGSQEAVESNLRDESEAGAPSPLPGSKVRQAGSENLRGREYKPA